MLWEYIVLMSAVFMCRNQGGQGSGAPAQLQQRVLVPGSGWSCPEDSRVLQAGALLAAAWLCALYERLQKASMLVLLAGGAICQQSSCACGDYAVSRCVLVTRSLSGSVSLEAYHVQGARFAKWRSVISIPSGPSNLALQDCAYGLARYAAIAQVSPGPYACACVCLLTCIT